MLAGHIGVALAIGGAQRQINAGIFVAAALWLDAVLWVLVLLGWESARIAADYGTTHHIDFVFPYSHGLVASLLWSALAGAAALLGSRRARASAWRGAVLMAAAVFSHWLLDALVHVPELPLLGDASPKVGLGLWHNMPLALLIEGLFVGVGLWLFLPGASASRARKSGMAVVCIVIYGFTVFGMTWAPAPPSSAALAAGSLVTLLLISAVAGWLAKPMVQPAVLT